MNPAAWIQNAVIKLTTAASRRRSSFSQKRILERAVSDAKVTYGAYSIEYAEAVEDLANHLRANEAFREAESLYPTVIRIRERQLGEKHASLGRVLHSLATVYHAQAKYDLADPLYERAIDVRIFARGENHVDVAESLNGLGGVQFAMKRANEGLHTCKKALEIREKAFNYDDRHPLIQQSLVNILRILRAQQKNVQAAPYVDRLSRVTRPRPSPGVMQESFRRASSFFRLQAASPATIPR